MVLLRATQFGYTPTMNAAAVAAEPANVLLLSPSASLASPRGWSSLSTMPKLTDRYDEVHCAGGGSLLLFLLFVAGKAPRLQPHGRVFFHGPIVYPTAQSCSAWLDALNTGNGGSAVDEYDWRQAALSLGFGGALHKECNHWLAPLASAVSAGRSYELAEKFNDLQARSVEKGRLVHLPGGDGGEEAVLTSLCRHTVQDSKLYRCAENECHDETDACQLYLA